MFEELNRMIKVMVIICHIFIPLGIWKLVEIIVWLIRNVSITLS